MSVVMFSQEDSFYVRKAVFRMILRRAKIELDDRTDIEELEIAELGEGISLFRMPDDQRSRIGDALLHGAQKLRSDVTAGHPTEEPVREGIESVLEDLIEFMTTRLQATE